MKIKQGGLPAYLKAVLFSIIGLVLAFVLINQLRIWAKHQNLPPSSINDNFSHPVNPLKSKFKVDSVATMEMEIDFEDFKKMRAIRQDAIDAGVLLTGDEDLAKAEIRYKGKTYKAETRLKGDWAEHMKGDAWSFRVKLKDNFTIEGMRKFSLQHPQRRNYAGEWLFHEMLKSEDVLSLRYKFINVNLVINNGGKKTVREYGYYVMEEFFDKPLIEGNGRREGVIVKIDEDPIWEERRRFLTNDLFSEYSVYLKSIDFKNYNVLPFGAKRIQSDPNLFKQFETARTYLESYIDDEVMASEVFDIEKLAAYNAICNVLGAQHSMILHNVRFYYNPINSKLEPIGFDGNAASFNWYKLNFAKTEKDLKYQEIYINKLREVSSNEYVKKILNWPGLKEHIELLEKIYPEYKFEDRVIIDNAKFLRMAIEPKNCLNSFLVDYDREYLRVNIENYGKFPVKINSIKLASGRVLSATMNSEVIESDERKTISFKLNKDYQRLFVKKKSGKVNFNPISDLEKISINFSTLGLENTRDAKILSWKPGSDAPLVSNINNIKTRFEEFDYIKINEETKVIECLPGQHKMENTLIIPKGYTFKIYPGTSLDFFGPNHQIISFSPVEFVGTADNPIKFWGSTKEGLGIIVLNADGPSKVEHCIFEGLAAPKTWHWSVSGGVNFYDSEVSIKNSAFTDARSEDALNIISTNFEMDNVVFARSFSDAFDGDFVTGTIKNCLFGDLGNDAIDVSGSNIEVYNTNISRAGDKGLSAGEKSTINARRLVVDHSEIGIASKDASTITVDSCLLDANNLGFTAFQKKSEFGSGHIIATNTDHKGEGTPYLIELNSSLLWNGEKAEVSDQVIDRMYGAEFGKKSER